MGGYIGNTKSIDFSVFQMLKEVYAMEGYLRTHCASDTKSFLPVQLFLCNYDWNYAGHMLNRIYSEFSNLRKKVTIEEFSCNDCQWMKAHPIKSGTSSEWLAGGLIVPEASKTKFYRMRNNYASTPYV